MLNIKSLMIKSIFFLALLFPAIGFASIVMTGTRIIYNESNKEKSIQLTNLGETPYVVETWVDNQKNSKENKNDAFIATPQIFKMGANSGQNIRLIKATNDLPNDVESLFYFNFNQIPATTDEQANQNQLALVFNTRVKIFYRPKSIENQTNSLEKLIVSKENNRLKIDNQEPFYIVIKDADLRSGNNNKSIVKSIILEPKSVTYWNNPFNKSMNDNSEVKLTIINDYGSSQVYTKKIN